VAKLDPDGRFLWAKQLGATTQAFGLGIARDSTGAVIVAGAYRGTIDAGGGPVQSAFNDGFVVKLDSGGNHVFTKSFGGRQNDEADGVAVTSDDRVLVTGQVSSDTVDFGGGPLRGGRFDDLYVVTLDPSGSHLCSRRYAGLDGSSAGLGIAVDPAKNAIVTGSFSGSLSFGADTLTSSGGLDIFVAKFLAE